MDAPAADWHAARLDTADTLASAHTPSIEKEPSWEVVEEPGGSGDGGGGAGDGGEGGSGLAVGGGLGGGGGGDGEGGDGEGGKGERSTVQMLPV